jgi:hypothetical protein
LTASLRRSRSTARGYSSGAIVAETWRAPSTWRVASRWRARSAAARRRPPYPSRVTPLRHCSGPKATGPCGTPTTSTRPRVTPRASLRPAPAPEQSIVISGGAARRASHAAEPGAITTSAPARRPSSRRSRRCHLAFAAPAFRSVTARSSAGSFARLRSVSRSQPSAAACRRYRLVCQVPAGVRSDWSWPWRARLVGVVGPLEGMGRRRPREGPSRAQQGPGEQEQLAHDGDDDHLGGLTLGPEALGEGAERGVRVPRHDSREVEGAAEVGRAEGPDGAAPADGDPGGLLARAQAHVGGGVLGGGEALDGRVGRLVRAVDVRVRVDDHAGPLAGGGSAARESAATTAVRCDAPSPRAVPQRRLDGREGGGERPPAAPARVAVHRPPEPPVGQLFVARREPLVLLDRGGGRLRLPGDRTPPTPWSPSSPVWSAETPANTRFPPRGPAATAKAPGQVVLTRAPPAPRAVRRAVRRRGAGRGPPGPRR